VSHEWRNEFQRIYRAHISIEAPVDDLADIRRGLSPESNQKLLILPVPPRFCP
jgi:hypothetical protein